MDEIKKIVESGHFKIIFYAVSVIMFAAVIFAAGIGVGMHKARYSYQWGENYERNFAGGPERRMGPGGPMPMDGPGGPGNFFERDMRNANGLAGQVVSVMDNLIIIKDRQNKENTVSVSDKTIIKVGRDDIKIEDLKIDDQIVVLGKPNEQGTVAANLIRVFDKNNK